ncbi:hypothetical protein FRC12_006942 [Ceratobasidium sp. 428]|nr:hypothetical protein FRC12_006942 [Ceratobasidium sp. 428]
MLNPLFEVPELLQAILERLESPRDAGRLACACRNLFNSCIPFAWKRVKSTTQLLSLLPGVTISKGGGANIVVVELPKLLTEADLSRFRFYATFVNTLNMFESTDESMYWILLNWEWIFSHSRVQPLLPNLHTLTFANWYVAERRRPANIWFTLFLSPQLSTFESAKISDFPTCFSFSESQFVLSAIADMCPRIHTLGFLALAASWANSTFMLPPDMDHTLYYRYNPGPLFSQMEHLKTLRVEIATLESLFSGGLFAVEWLEVNMGFKLTNEQLPFDSFPYLKHFGIFNCVHTLVPTLPSCVTPLTSLQLHFGYLPNDIREILSKIAEYNPCLLDLSIHPFHDPTYVSDTENRRWPLLEVATLEPLARLLRLERFCLSDMIVVSPSQDAAEVLSYIGGLLPSLRVLEIPHQVIPLSKLSKVVLQLPRLECLSSTVTELGIVGQPRLDQPTSALRILESEFDRGFVRAARKNKLTQDADLKIAGYLASLCVNVQILNRPSRNWKYSLEESVSASRLIASINNHLSVLAPQCLTPYKNATYPTSQTPWQLLRKDMR